MRYTCRTNSTDETVELGKKIALILKDVCPRGCFLSLYGEMGVGKTAFVRGFASAFGVRGVKSPTYTMVNEYRSPDGVKIFHFDLYRIESEEDLCSIGFDDYLGQEGYCLAEWSENVESALPSDRLRITIGRLPENEEARSVALDLPQGLADAFAGLFLTETPRKETQPI